jgi:hypothetical protein
MKKKTIKDKKNMLIETSNDPTLLRDKEDVKSFRELSYISKWILL